MQIKPMTLAVAGVGVLAAATTLLPESIRPWNFSAIGAVALFAAARLGFLPALAVVAVALAVKDLGVYLNHGMNPYPLSWLFFAAYALIGWAFLRRTESPLKIGAAATGAGGVFFGLHAVLSRAYFPAERVAVPVTTSGEDRP